MNRESCDNSPPDCARRAVVVPCLPQRRIRRRDSDSTGRPIENYIVERRYNSIRDITRTGYRIRSCTAGIEGVPEQRIARRRHIDHVEDHRLGTEIASDMSIASTGLLVDEFPGTIFGRHTIRAGMGERTGGDEPEDEGQRIGRVATRPACPGASRVQPLRRYAALPRHRVYDPGHSRRPVDRRIDTAPTRHPSKAGISRAVRPARPGGQCRTLESNQSAPSHRGQ